MELRDPPIRRAAPFRTLGTTRGEALAGGWSAAERDEPELPKWVSEVRWLDRAPALWRRRPWLAPHVSAPPASTCKPPPRLGF